MKEKQIAAWETCLVEQRANASEARALGKYDMAAIFDGRVAEAEAMLKKLRKPRRVARG